jgi:endonuclease/exonuclease/phosphatase family metal-dependent hydrolase
VPAGCRHDSRQDGGATSFSGVNMSIKKTVLILLSLIILGVTISGAQSPLRVMTFNIRYNEPRDKENAWPNRKEKAAGVIRFHKADLVGVQEALIGQLKDLEALLPDFAWCGKGRADGKESGEFSAILYRKSRFKLLDTRTTWLSETPLVAGSKGWGANYPRIITWAKFYDNLTKREFFHFNTHFDHESERARQESARIIVKQAGEIAGKLPFVITGDFNAVENSDPYRVLTAKGTGIKDAGHSSLNPNFGPTSTFNNFGPLIPNRKIDFIFVRDDLIVTEHGVLADQWDGLWASDHLPVLAEISFAK